MIITSVSLRALNTALTAKFNEAFAGVPSDFEKIAMTVPSSKGSNTYAWLGATTGFREWLGDRVIQNLKTHDYTIKNVQFENTIAIYANDIKDDDIGLYNPTIETLGYDAKKHPDKLVFGLLKNGFAGLCYDGQPFFSATHPLTNAKGKTVQVSNMQAGTNPAWFLLDTSRPIKPIIFQKREDYKFVAKEDPKDENVFRRNEYLYGVDCRVAAGYALWQMAYASKAALTQENFEKAYAAMCSLQNEKEDPLGIRPTILVVPPALRSAAMAIVTSEKLANGADNPNKGLVTVLDTAWLV